MVKLKDNMEATESPLDVLSRAATMLQENQEALSNIEDGPKDCSNKHLPTTKWKRERRNRLPEYSRTDSRSDRCEPSNGDYQSSPSPEHPICSTNGIGSNGFFKAGSKETPLDMSVRQRGLPPSYAQTINNPGYRSNYRLSTIVNGPPPPVPKEEIPAGVNSVNGISMCDPIIDEHFRRSLGENYHTLFMNNNISKESAPAKTSPSTPTHATLASRQVDIGDLMDNTGMSVDDHFAKALGETWVKLNKKQSDIKSNSSENQNLVSI
ncbi:hypothetical protein HHI36_008937 [Cryptolaemus montrouzieri]|uniref:Transcription cofactor vestigial-like protein 4 n=1 Tax=Cryptolaemus montrouzieri TaxID=559131 RepID=A0ABD2MTU1_9CUCU